MQNVKLWEQSCGQVGSFQDKPCAS
uniref:Uncharacterized protein n=1 Tax=Rhizophora mucronata TaxID=61149 RepID=A0A2P2NCT8_RHIMU